MVEVEQVTIAMGMPSDVMRVVAMQPFVRLSPNEPFQWPADRVDGQLNAIRGVLDLAQRGLESKATNFTVFPEYSIPGVLGAGVIDEQITSHAWPNESVIIGGIHGLTQSEYAGLCQRLSVQTSPANAPASVPKTQWVNCCLVWAKDRDGVVHRWAQLKVRPAWPELNTPQSSMYCGTTVYDFKCVYRAPSNYPCHFLVLVCYDWVASVGGVTVCDEMLAQIAAQCNGSPRPLHWLFVIQHNPKPNSATFLQSTYKFLTDEATYALVERNNAVVLHINTANSENPSRATDHHGFSACVLPPLAPFDCRAYRPTVCLRPVPLRKSNILEHCQDVVFREMGQCTHMFGVHVPKFVTRDNTGRTPPLSRAEVHAIGDVHDPRLPGGEVPGVLKWLNDSLDAIEALASPPFAGCSLGPVAEKVRDGVISDMRWVDGQTATNRMNWASCSLLGRTNGTRSNPNDSDLWDQHETEALEHVVHSLTSFGLTYQIDVAASPLHGTLNSAAGFVQLVAIRGQTHQDCRRHYDRAVRPVGNDPVLVITRDDDNLTPTLAEYSKFCDPDNEHGLRFLDYQTLVTYCRESADTHILRKALDDYLPREPRII